MQVTFGEGQKVPLKIWTNNVDKNCFDQSIGASPSYIVRGLGNPESFCSASHGAGRLMGRKEAKRTITIDQVKKSLEGIIHINTVSKLTDECPLAYKSIEDVIAHESDLVTPIMKLKPIAFLKGEGE